MITLLFYLICGHVIWDFPLQGSTVATEKSPNSTSELQKIVPWPYWLTAHALTHGFMVALLTGSVILGIAETIAHWIIDFYKCKGHYSIHTDQALHILCKLVWVIILFR